MPQTLVQKHVSIGPYSLYMLQWGSFGRICSVHSETRLQCKPRHKKWGQSEDSLQKYALIQTTVCYAADIATCPQLTQANKPPPSGFSISMEHPLTPVRAHPSTNSRHPLKSKLLPQSHLLVTSATSAIMSLNPSKGRVDPSAKRPDVKSCCQTSGSTLPVLEELPRPSW